MADNPLQNVLGFFYKIGSTDYPFNADPNSAFGFDVNGSTVTTVFKFSINDIEKSFSQVRELRMKSYWGNGTDEKNSYDSNTKMNCLLAESANLSSTDYSPIASESITNSEFWQQAFKIMEFVFENQLSVQSTQNVWGGGNSYGDSALINEKDADGETNPFYCDRMVGHLSFVVHLGTTRLSDITFTLRDDNNRAVQFHIYFYADDFIARSSSDGSSSQYYVYRYNDTNNDNVISDAEFRDQIVKILFNNTGSGKYKTWSSYKVDKRLSDTTYTTEQYFVFSTTSDTISDDVMKTQIKKYLREEYASQGSDYEALLRYTYPTLFTENTITIYPMWTNYMTGSSGQNIDLHPVNVNDVVKELTGHGVEAVGDTRSKNAQIFYVGPGAGWNPNVEIPYIKPLLAVEEDTSSGITNPISDRFPDYQPIFGQDKNGDAAEFHFILIMVLNVLMGISEFDDSFVSEFEVTTETSGSTKIVRFIFAGNTWQVYGPITNN